MDQRISIFGAALAIALAAGGCNRFGGDASQPATIADVPGPEVVVAEFLEAVRTGDDKQAAVLLTPLARRKTADMEMVVAPPGSDTARFAVHEVEFVSGGAHVATNWTDLDTDGREHTDRIVWLLRREQVGWRIAGMATKVFPDQEPIVLNFEDPEEMLRQQQLAEDEIDRRDRGAAPQAKNPGEESDARVR